jgi:penicillin-binding protein 1A
MTTDPARARLGAPEAEDTAPPPAEVAKRAPKRRGSLIGWVLRAALIVAGVAVVGGGVAGYGLYHSLSRDLPAYSWLADYSPPQMSRVYASDSRLMAELAAERRVFVPVEAIPRRLQLAFVSAEDQNFFHHHGVDPAAIARAAVTNLQNIGTGRRMIGASTITQQVAKNMLVGSDRTVLRKAREAMLALRIESALPKERILEIYLNEIFLGFQAYGVAAAAQAYFNKSLDELTLGEMAYLAALPKAPNNYHPIRFPEAARARRDWVLDRMAEDGHITREEAAAAKAEGLQARILRRPETVSVGQHFTEEVRRELISRFGQEQTQGGGLVVRTSLDPRIQAAAEQALRQGLLNYDRRRGGWRGPVARIPAGQTEWLPALDALPRTPGALPEWRMAVVLEVRPNDARIGWVERSAPRAPAEPRTGTILLSDMASWARPVVPNPPNQTQAPVRLGPQPRRMADLMAPGDVILVEREAARPAQGREPARAERIQVRQIPEVEGAVVALDPDTGRVLAMAGGWSFERSQFNRATQAQRQPGSSFKPFVYLPALEAGIPPNQRFLDAPVEIATPQGVWRPANYSGNSNGYVTIRTALERSLNLVTVRMAQEVGMERVAETAQRFGVIDNMPRFLSMSLGAGETTVLRMAAGYAAFVNGGRRVEPTFIDSVQDQRGRVVWRPSGSECRGCEGGPEAGPPTIQDTPRRIADPVAAFQMVNILQGAVQRGTGSRAGQGLNRPVSGKTGTTDDYKDNWFVGFTPELVVAVWVGYDEPRSLGSGETGGTNAAPIFRDVIAAALGNSPAVPFRAPPGTALVRITTDGGATILEAFRPGTENSARPPTDEGFTGASAGPGFRASGTEAARVDSSLGGLY